MPEGNAAAAKPDQAEMIRRAEALIPPLKERRAQSLQDRRLSDKTIADLIAADMFKIMQPAHFGGLELPFGSQVAISAAMAAGCGAASWLVSVFATHHYMLAKFDARVQADVWGKNPNAICCSAFSFAQVQAKAVDGGYQLTGRWPYSSGSHAADWAMISMPIETTDGSPPPRRFAIIPRSDFEVLDNWRSTGLRGSGSNDIVIKDAFVPAYRTIAHEDLDKPEPPGLAVNTGPTYRLQTFGVFNLTGVGPTLGLARAALDAFTGGMRQRRNVLGSKIPEMQNIQIRTSHASAEIDAAWLIAMHHVSNLQKASMEGRQVERSYVLKIQRDCAYVGKICQSAVGSLIDAMGGGGLSEDNVVQMAYADMKGACAHITMGWDANSVPYGKHLFGIEHKGII